MAETEKKLPQNFITRMKDMLGNEYNEFISAFDKENPYVGMRISALKSNSEEAVFSEIGDSEQVLWCKNGYYTDKKTISCVFSGAVGYAYGRSTTDKRGRFCS